MRRNNFEEMSSLSDSNNRIRELGSFIQDLENQLWDGHPHIYPNLRIFLEEWCDLIIDVGVGLRIREENGGKTRREIHQYYDELVRQNKMVESLCGKELIVDNNAWSFSLKVRTVECVFKERGINTRNWRLSNQGFKQRIDNNLKDNLNHRAHEFTPISENREEAFGQFEARFGVLQILHEGVYKDFLENVFNVPVEPYLMPNKMDIIEMLGRYYGDFSIDKHSQGGKK